MRRFKNILTYVNLSLDEHPALERGVRLARHNNANLTAMTVIEEYPAQAHALLRSIHLEDALETIERENREQLERIVQPIRDAGLAVETVVAHGSTFIEVIRAALQRQHDLVIKTVSSEGVFHRTFFGSIDMHLLRKCPTPLWLIKPGEPEAFRQILVPLDPNMEDAVKHDLGIDLLTLATSLVEMDSAELMIVHAWRAYEEGKLKKYMESKQFEEYLHKWGQEASKRVWNFVSSFGREFKPTSIHLVQGEPGEVIPKFAKDHNVDLLVTGTLGRLGQHGMFIGDTAERILGRLECSVLAVKPAGFVSPVH
ncbi:universal stress protein [Symmachiella dynata]|uniref:universal stress protein n=1 Tax=Symmachiella dynata TaxID=2527995 RepID=UPI0030EBCF2A